VPTRCTGARRRGHGGTGAPGPGSYRRVALCAAGAAVAYVVLPSAVHIFIWRTRWQPGLDALRRYHRRVDQRQILRKAGGAGQSAAVVHHTGRRSGRVYSTAVWAHRVGESFWVGLPYGTDVDWLRNVRAAGGCEIEHDGVRRRVVDPVVLPATELPAALGRARTMLRLMGVREALRVDIAPAEPPAPAETASRGGTGVER
jgi:deazaflavin-dependent oxidoreductase (nitroreductase family)